MGYSAKAVANAFLQIAERHKAAVSPLKLQKLVYIAHGWRLGLDNAPLVSNELAEAWQYGPVFPSLYQEFKEFGKEPIRKKATELNFSPSFEFEVIEPEIPEGDTYVWQLLNKVWGEYGKFGAMALSDLTHRVGTPWEVTRQRNGSVNNADISNDLINDHYKELIQRRP